MEKAMTTPPSQCEGAELGRKGTDGSVSGQTLPWTRRQSFLASFLYLLGSSLLRILLFALNLIAWGAARLFPRKRGRELKKVVHVSPTYFDENSVIGGGERYATQLAAAMTGRVNESVLVTFGKHKGSVTQAGLKIRTYRPLMLMNDNPINPIAFSFLKELWKADIVHCHQYRTVTTNLCILVATILRRRVFVTELGGGGLNYAEDFHLGSKIDGFLLPSRFCRDLLFTRYADRTTIVYGGVDVNRFKPLPGCQREKKALFVGRLLPHKGINYLIEGIDDNIQLDIVGKIYDPSYYRYLQKLSQGKRIRFMTEAFDEDIIREYCSSTVTVLPSVYEDIYSNTYEAPEYLGLTLLESMTCGTPVICTDVGGMPEIVEDGITGFVVPPNDAVSLGEKIRYLMYRPEVRDQMGRAGRKKVLEMFTWDVVAHKCLEAYEKCQTL